MAGNKRSVEGDFQRWISPILAQAGYDVYPIENEAIAGMSDLMLADTKGMAFAELKSTVAHGMAVDFTLFTKGQKDFLESLPAPVPGVLIVEIRNDPDKGKWVIAVIGKGMLPTPGVRGQMNMYYTDVTLRRNLTPEWLAESINRLGRKQPPEPIKVDF